MTNKLEARKQARELIIQSLYEFVISANPINQIVEQGLKTDKPLDREYFTECLLAIHHNLIDLDSDIAQYLSRKPKEVDPVELSVLRLAAYELKERLDVPYRVVINEALDNAKKYGSSDGYKFVNGVLDKLAKQFRKEETKRKR